MTRHLPHPARRLLHLMAGLLAVAALALAVLLVAVPRLLGWVPLTIVSGSMAPTIPVGSQVVVEPVDDAADVARVQVGEVITFMPNPEDPTLVTHRVVTRSLGTDGSAVLTTQGDANDYPDGLALTDREVRGVVRYDVPVAGYVAQALDGSQKSLGVTLAAGALGAYAVAQVALAGRDRRRARTTTTTEAAPAAGTMELHR